MAACDPKNHPGSLGWTEERAQQSECWDRRKTQTHILQEDFGSFPAGWAQAIAVWPSGCVKVVCSNMKIKPNI